MFPDTLIFLLQIGFRDFLFSGANRKNTSDMKRVEGDLFTLATFSF